MPLTDEQKVQLQKSIDNLEKMRGDLDKIEYDLKNTHVGSIEVKKMCAEEAIGIASQGIAQASFYCGVMYGQQTRINELEAKLAKLETLQGLKERTLDDWVEEFANNNDFVEAFMQELLLYTRQDLADAAYSAVCVWAHWKDGEQYVGTSGRTLSDAKLKIQDYFGREPRQNMEIYDGIIHASLKTK